MVASGIFLPNFNNRLFRGGDFFMNKRGGVGYNLCGDRSIAYNFSEYLLPLCRNCGVCAVAKDAVYWFTSL